MAETTWEQVAGMVSDEDTDNIESYSEQALASKNAAAVSAAAAEAAKIAAAASEVDAESAEANAAASEAAAASSASSASTSATTATTKASEASTSATNAATSATAAQTAQTASEVAQAAAATSETNAATSESNASTSAIASASSAIAASASQTAAAGSATAASASAAAASASEASASASEAIAVTSANNAASSAAGAAGSATNAAASATSAAASETAAATSETNAATSETNAAASSSSAATSATTATTKASEAATSAANAATSEGNASSSATASAASATAASSSETAAASSATSASTSASTATTKASEASTSATNAATSEGNAATSASSAATSASAAEASKDAALAALDSFDDRYLGQKASDPTVDNDGDPLVAGALYFNTTDDVMKVYEGSLWVAAYASLSGALLQANNLSDLNNAATARTNLGLGTAATTASSNYATAAQGALADSAIQPNDSPTFVNVTVTGTVDGRDVAADGSKLDGIEAGATADQTASEILTAIKTVDGTGSGLDADLLDGNDSTFFYPASNPSGYTTNVGDITGVTAGSFLTGGGTSGTVTVNVDATSLNTASKVVARDASGNFSAGTITAALTGNASTASTLQTARNIALTGAVTGNANFDGGGNISISTSATSDPTLTLAGDATGAATFTNLGNATLTVNVVNDSHTHTFTVATDDRDMKPNTSGIGAGGFGIKPFFSSYGGMTGAADTDYQDVLVLDTYSDTSGGNANAVTFDKSDGSVRIWNASHTATSWGTPQRLFADNYHPNADKWTTPRTLSLSGDVSGSTSWDGSGNATLTVTVVDDSHNHIIGNVDGLQAALDGKLSTSGKAADSNLLDALDSTQFLRSDTADTATGVVTFTDRIDLHEIRTNTGQELILNAGESASYATGQTSEFVYVNAEDGFQVNTSPDNWTSGWAGRVTHTLNASLASFGTTLEIPARIQHTGDTDTYMEFHAADQWRVVTGNVERFEINNSNVTVQSALKEKYVALSGTTPSIDVDAGGGFSLTTSGNTTFTFTAFTSALSCGFILELTAGGAHTITWPASVDWAGGTAPDAPASGETDILVFWSRDGGTTWYGVLSVDAAA